MTTSSPASPSSWGVVGTFLNHVVTTAALALALVVMIVATGAVDAQQPTPVTVCVTCRVARTPQTLHAHFAATYFGETEYPELAVTSKLVGVYEASGTTSSGLVRAYIANGSDCDVVVGPGSSGISIAISPVMQALWICYSSTSTELSSRFNYPSFSRVVPTDEAATAGWEPVFEQLGWRSLGVICADTTYARSVVAGMASVMESLDGSSSARSCLAVDAPYSDVLSEVRRVAGGTDRVVLLAMSTSNQIFPLVLQAILAERAFERISFIFADSACSSGSTQWATIPYAFCGTFAVNSTRIDPFLTSYRARNISAVSAEYQSLGWPVSEIDFNSTGTYPAYAVDATRLALHTLASYARANNGAKPASYTEAIEFMRTLTLEDGVTGAVEIPTGDRTAADIVVYSSGPAVNGTGTGTYMRFANASGSEAQLATEIYAFGQLYATVSVPASTIARVVSTSDSSTSRVIAISIGSSVPLIVFAILMAAHMVRSASGRDNSFAPKDESAEFTVIFTDIQSSTALWATAPQEVGPAVDQHHELIRAVLDKHHGYEVKTIGDSFMVAFENPLDALKAAHGIQSSLFEADWPACIDAVYRAKAMEDGWGHQDGANVAPDVDVVQSLMARETPSSSNPLEDDADGGYSSIWNGIRVRVGMHTGKGSIKLDPVTRAYDYYGTVVNTAARVEGVGHGGQILLTSAALQAVRQMDGGSAYVDESTITMNLGAQPLRGLEEPVELVQVQPKLFDGRRKFPPLRLDVERVVTDDDDDVDTESAGAGAGGGGGGPLSDGASVDRVETMSALGISAQVGGGALKIPRNAPEYICFRAAVYQQGGGSFGTHRTYQATFEGLVLQYQLYKVLFSTLPVRDRERTVIALGKKWRIAPPLLNLAASGPDREQGVDRILATLACRSAPVAAATSNEFVHAVRLQQQHLQNQPSASSGEGGAAGRSPSLTVSNVTGSPVVRPSMRIQRRNTLPAAGDDKSTTVPVPLIGTATATVKSDDAGHPVSTALEEVPSQIHDLGGTEEIDSSREEEDAAGDRPTERRVMHVESASPDR